MKKFYSLISVLLLSIVTTFGQLAMRPVTKNQNAPSSVYKLNKQSNQSNARHGNPQNHTASIIWSDDFSNAANWSITNDIGNTDDWVIGTTPPSGSFAIDPIASTSAANGFALYDSDLMCSGDQIGNLTNVTPINCTGHNNVRIRFEEYYRKYIDSTFLYVSNDGINWTLYSLNTTLQPNDFVPTNPTNINVDISSVAGNQATVFIRFTFYSPASLDTVNNFAGCAYSWMIDDVIVEDAPSDDIAMVLGFPSQYTVIPLLQVQPIDLSAQIANLGVNDETNVGFNASVYYSSDNGGSFAQVFNGPSAAAATLNAGDTSAALSAGTFSFSDTGIYAFQYISYMTNADEDGSNDTLTYYMIVSDSIYTRDFASIIAQLLQVPFRQSINNALGFNTGTGNLGQIYDAITNSFVKSVSIYCDAPTTGDQVTVSMYSVAGGMPDALLSTSQPYTFTAGDNADGVFLTLPLSNPIAVTAGSQFFVCADQVVADNNLSLGFSTQVFTPNTAFFQVSGGGWNAIESTGTFLGAFVCRANLDLDDQVGESEFSKGISVYPNPSNGKLFIHNSGQKENMTITVLNSVGQVVYSNSFDHMTTASIDLSSQSSGVYSVQLKSEKEVTTKSIVISNK